MSLLTAAQIAQIRGAIKDVTDTFAITPITLYQVDVIDDIFNEDRDNTTTTVFNVNALAEIDQEDMAKEEGETGAVDYDRVKLTLNVDDMITAGVVVAVGDGTFKSVLESERDLFLYKAELYRILDITFDGPLEPKEVLLTIKGEKTQTKMNFNLP